MAEEGGEGFVLRRRKNFFMVVVVVVDGDVVRAWLLLPGAQCGVNGSRYARMVAFNKSCVRVCVDVAL